MDIQKQTNNILQQAIKRYSEENEVSVKETQLMITTYTPECKPVYKVLKNFKPIKDVGFNEILDLKIDFLGREIIATPFITNAIMRIIKENSCEYSEVNVLIYSNDENGDDLKLHLFIGNQPKKELTMNYLFGNI
jgi:hypothetical protein